VRAPARKPRWLNPAPCTAAKGIYLVGACKQELAGGTLLGDAVDVTRKRNGGEDAWSLFRISRAPDTSSTKRRCACCIDLCQTQRSAKKSLDGHGAFQCGHFLRSILALAETRGDIRGNFRVRGAGQDPRLLPSGDLRNQLLLGIRPAELDTAFQCPRCGQRTSTQTTAESSIVWGEPRGLLSRRRSGF
jgi:hypothetical protein